ncbi:MAG TPA: MerR family DNA-binding protein [Longimicrobiales bacterium]|nr:MerR family DNA-binding protein [Longimicrobiales bacterium]
MKGLRSGEVAVRAGIGLEALRFYERRGLVPVPPRAGNGYREFPVETVARIRFIQRAQQLGFSLEEIGELLGLRVEADVDCEGVRVRAEAKLAEVEEKIRDLERIRSTLGELVQTCLDQGSSGDCPILAALEPAQK